MKIIYIHTHRTAEACIISKLLLNRGHLMFELGGNKVLSEPCSHGLFLGHSFDKKKTFLVRRYNLPNGEKNENKKKSWTKFLDFKLGGHVGTDSENIFCAWLYPLRTRDP